MHIYSYYPLYVSSYLSLGFVSTSHAGEAIDVVRASLNRVTFVRLVALLHAAHHAPAVAIPKVVAGLTKVSTEEVGKRRVACGRGGKTSDLLGVGRGEKERSGDLEALHVRVQEVSVSQNEGSFERMASNKSRVGVI